MIKQKHVESSQTTRVNRSYMLRTHHRIPLLRYTSLWLWAVAVQASRHYNSQQYPKFLCPAPQRHQSQHTTPTITPKFKTSLRNSHDFELQKRTLYTNPQAHEEDRASQTPTAPTLSSTKIWPFRYPYIPSLSSKPTRALFSRGVLEASMCQIYRPAGVSMDLLLCSDGAWTTGTGRSHMYRVNA